MRHSKNTQFQHSIQRFAISAMLPLLLGLPGCGGGGAGSSSGGGITNLALSASPTSVQTGGTSTLTVTTTGSGSYTLAVNGTTGGNTTTGTVVVTASGGTYTAPSAVPSGGTVSVQATADNGVKSNTVTITVTAAPTVSIAMTDCPTAEQKGIAYTCVATVTNPLGTGTGLSWYSTNTAVATVVPSTGVVTYVGVGTATISATATADTSKSAAVNVTVHDWLFAASAYHTYLVDVTGTNQPVSMVDGCSVSARSWNKASFVCTIGNGTIKIYQTDGTTAGTTLTHTINTGLYSVLGASFSPDDKSLVYNAIAFESDGVTSFDGVYTISIATASSQDDTGQKLLASDPPMSGVGANSPRFSPDGKTILWGHAVNGKEYLWTMGADGSNQQQFLNVPAGGGIYLPNGKTILYYHASGGVYSINADGTGGENLLVPSTTSVAPVPMPAPDGESFVYGQGTQIIDVNLATLAGSVLNSTFQAGSQIGY